MNEPAPLSAAERAALLGIARGTILNLLGAAPGPALPSSGTLAEPRGAFVTLTVEGELRGCIGTFTPRGSLAETVAAMARAAATEDPRFTRLRPDEIKALSISVSALRTPHLLEDRSRIEVGVHGLLVRKGWNRGALLPKVAVEHGWEGVEQLQQLPAERAVVGAGFGCRDHMQRRQHVVAVGAHLGKPC